MRLWFALGTDVRLNEQLVTQVILAVLCNDLSPGQRLPTRPPSLPIYLPPISSEVALDRRVEVRLEHSDATNATIGGAIGAGAGTSLGAASLDSHSRGAAMALFGVLGFAMGSAINRALPITHRGVIYRRQLP